MTGSAQNTINRSKNRLGLLLKQYYDDPGLGLGGPAQDDEYSLAKLQKLRSDALMGKTVESLRSYKEAESDLRMLLYNNCDKLLKAVHVVCDIREGSRAVEQSASELDSIVNRDWTAETQSLGPYNQLLAAQRVLDLVAELESVGEKILRESRIPVQDRIKLFLEIRETVFDKLSYRFGLIGKISRDCRTIVEEELVPRLMSEASDDIVDSLQREARRSRVGLLMALFPRGHPRHGEIMEHFVELEIANFDDKLRGLPAFGVQETLTNLNSLVGLLFVCQEFENKEMSDKIATDLVPRASEQIVKSVQMFGISGASVEEVLEAIQTATNAHLRIPQVSEKSLSEFSKSCLKAWIKFQFRSAANACVTEDLPPLLAASAFGACCDVIHTRCCTVIAQANDAEGLFEDVLACVYEYYEIAALPTLVGDTDVFETSVKGLKMLKFIATRHTVERTLNALADIFAHEEVQVERPVVASAMHAEVRLMGEWVGHSAERLERAVKEGLVPVLDAPANATRSSKRPSELDSAEMVHSRKLLLPASGLPTIDVGVLIVGALYYRAVREAVISGEQGLEDRAIVPEWLDKLVGGPSSESSQILNAMARDTLVPNL